MMITLLAGVISLASAAQPLLLPKPAVPVEIKNLHTKVQELATNTKLHRPALLYIFLDEFARNKFPATEIEQRLGKLKSGLDARTQSILADSELMNLHRAHIRKQLAKTTAHSFAEVLARPTAKEVLSQPSVMLCVDYAKAVAELARDSREISEIKVPIMAETAPLQRVCASGTAPQVKADPIDIPVGYAALIQVRIKNKGLYLVNFEAPELEVFALDSDLARMQEIEFPFFKQKGVASFTMTGYMPLETLRKGYDARVAQNIHYSGNPKSSVCHVK